MQPSRRLFARLEKEIASAPTAAAADCLRAERIAYLARNERGDEARTELAELRRRYSSGAQPVVTAWINFADSIVDRAAFELDSALQKMRRAHAIGGVLNDVALQVLTASWLTYLHWDRQDPVATERHALDALRSMRSTDHAAVCRLSLAIGEILLLSHREAAGRPWWLRARSHAMTVGDDASLSALQYNLASVRAMQLRQSVMSGVVDTAVSAAGTAFQAEASRNFDQTIGIPLDARTTLQEASILSLQGNAAGALAIYEAQLPDHDIPAASRGMAEWLSDQAWCLARLGHLDRARQLAVAAEAALAPELQIDDLATVHSHLALVFDALDARDDAARHRARADQLWSEYRAFQDRCASLFESMVPPA